MLPKRSAIISFTPTCILALVFAFSLTGCVTPSQSEVDADVDRATAAALAKVSDEWRAAGSTGAVQVGWIAAFDDPVLLSLVREAQANNLNLAAAAAGVEQARALARQAGASLTPDINLNVGAGRGGLLDSNAPGPASTLNAGIQVAWEADLWGRIRSGVAQASASAQAAEADYQFAQYSVAANTAIAYFTAIEARLQTQIARDSLENLNNAHRIVQAQYDEGVASAQDLALSKSDRATAQERVVSLAGVSRDALRALELLLGRYPGADIAVRDTLPAAPASPPTGVPAEILERRPDLVAAERQVAAAFNAVNQAKAARLPSLSLTGDLGGTSAELSSLLDPANVSWRIGTNLLSPLFDGGRRRENVRIANAQQEAALAQYANAALRAFADVESALDQGQVLADRSAQLEEAAEQAAEAYRLAELRYREGETSLIDLLTIQQRVFSSRSAQSSVQRLLLQQRVNLNLALGGSWDL